MNPILKKALPLATAFFILCVGPLRVYSQETTGFYVIMKYKKGCPHKLFTKDLTKPYCLTKEPIITENEFEEVSDVEYDSLLESNSLTLKLTMDGYKTLKVLTEKLPDTKLALVIDHTVAGIFDNANKVISRTLPIRGGIDGVEIEWIHSKLKKDKP